MYTKDLKPWSVSFAVNSVFEVCIIVLNWHLLLFIYWRSASVTAKSHQTRMFLSKACVWKTFPDWCRTHDSCTSKKTSKNNTLLRPGPFIYALYSGHSVHLDPPQVCGVTHRLRGFPRTAMAGHRRGAPKASSQLKYPEKEEMQNFYVPGLHFWTKYTFCCPCNPPFTLVFRRNKVKINKYLKNHSTVFQL